MEEGPAGSGAQDPGSQGELSWLWTLSKLRRAVYEVLKKWKSWFLKLENYEANMLSEDLAFIMEILMKQNR